MSTKQGIKQDEAFEQDITQLYQQRKGGITAPNVNVSALIATVQKPKRKTSWLNMLLLLMSGGIASFSILAIISHLSLPPAPSEASLHDKYAIEISITELSNDVDTPIAVKRITKQTTLPEQPSLAKMPEATTPIKHDKSLTTIVEQELHANVTHQFIMPQLEITEQPKLTTKVMPKYSADALKNQHQGRITLSYQINARGEVTNIELLESSINPQLQRSAKRALAQWRFQENEGDLRRYQVVFEFKLTEDKS